jgi:hypothetical protein
MTPVSNYANYQGLRLLLHPDQPGSTIYVLSLENNGPLELWNVQLDLENVSGPAAFGLDDTHMRRAPHADRVEVNHLAPGEVRCLRRGARESIAGQKVAGEKSYVTFAARSDGYARFGQRLVVEEIGDAR